MQHVFKLGEHEYQVALSRARQGYRLHLGERSIPVNLHREDDGSARLTVNGVSERVHLAVRGDEVFVHLDGASHTLRYVHPLVRLARQRHAAAEDEIRAPMPGSVVALAVQAGQSVTQGQTLLVMESMKMETTIIAPRDGVVEAVQVDQGQTFDRDALLLTLAPEKTA